MRIPNPFIKPSCLIKVWVDVCYLQPRILSGAHIWIQNWCKISQPEEKALRNQDFINQFNSLLVSHQILKEISFYSRKHLEISFHHLSFYFFLSFCGACCTACGILVPRPGLRLCFLQWKHGVLTNYWTASLFLTQTVTLNQNLPSPSDFPRFTVHPPNLPHLSSHSHHPPTSSTQLSSTINPLMFAMCVTSSQSGLFILPSLISLCSTGKSCRKTSCRIPEKPWIQVKNSSLM